MFRKIIPALLLVASSICIGIGQNAQISLILVDQSSGDAVNNAHGFLSNTTFGSVSSNNGDLNFQIPSSIKEDLIISHIAYETRILNYNEYSNATLDTLVLIPVEVSIDEIAITAKRSKKWKKNFKRFKKAFFGEDKAAGKCKILNPEVLRFDEQNEAFVASAIAPLEIINDYLGYEISYSLRHLEISKDGSAEYLGRAFFKDLHSQKSNNKIEKNREKSFLNSPKYFFKSLIDNQLEESGFISEIALYRNNQFILIGKPGFEELVHGKDNNVYRISFQEFLKVTDKKNKTVEYSNVGAVRRGGLESQRFGSSGKSEKTEVNYAVSYLYKIEPYLYVNKYGNILNTEAVKEYGFWADQKFAHQLPFDYGNDYTGEANSDHALSQQKESLNSSADNPQVDLLMSLIFTSSEDQHNKSLGKIKTSWEEAYIPALIDILGMSSDRTLIRKIDRLLTDQTGHKGKADYYSWLNWLWSNDPIYSAYYFDFKGELYELIDPKFGNYFKQRAETSKIRLDEVLWGGVKQDGIPPLRHPELITASEADYLDDSDLVFGVIYNGIAHAYPKRILAWHEFVVDKFDESIIAGVYCTLCGTVIAYNTEHNGKKFDLGTSGFLYKFNKLMYDKATQSLWNTIEGEPVIGPLAHQNISLETIPVVTTSWKEWKENYPHTLVLSLNTGYNRDYSEGAAYRDYFATDDLMFPVPVSDNRLKNKDEVLVIRSNNYEKDPLAISLKYLKKKKWWQGQIGDSNFLVLHDLNGISRTFQIDKISFKSYKQDKLTDVQGNFWRIYDQFIEEEKTGLQYLRVPTHRIFWFAWLNAYPSTRLIH